MVITASKDSTITEKPTKIHTASSITKRKVKDSRHPYFILKMPQIESRKHVWNHTFCQNIYVPSVFGNELYKTRQFLNPIFPSNPMFNSNLSLAYVLLQRFPPKCLDPLLLPHLHQLDTSISRSNFFSITHSNKYFFFWFRCGVRSVCTSCMQKLAPTKKCFDSESRTAFVSFMSD